MGDTQAIEKKEQCSAFYSGRYKYGYDWRAYLSLSKRMLDIMTLTGAKDKKIIDVGCGIGWFTDMMYFNISRFIKGIDFSEVAINYCKRVYPAFESEVADVYKYDYTGYDVFVLMEILEHLDGDTSIIKLFPQGAKVYGTVPYRKMRADIAHVREYTEGCIKKRYGRLLDIQSITRQGQFIIFYGVRK